MVILFGLIVAFAAAVIVAAPATWLLMLFLGNLGVHVGFWGCLPGALFLGLMRSTVETKK